VVMQSRTRELAFDAFDDFSYFVKSISCGTSKTCHVRGSHPCRDPCGTVRWPRQKRQLAAMNWRSRSQTEDLTSFQKALFEGRRYHRSSARFAKNWSIARLRTADWSFPSGSPSYLLTGLQRNPPQPQLTIRD
jgi:hypothetical protein